MNPSVESSTEALLAQTGWMRALALGLVHDSHAADDVAQDAALAALLHPPPAGVELRPWLAQVVRRLAWRRSRSKRRRSERESMANEPAGPQDPSQTLARLDLQRELLEAVRALEEPVRTTIVQRYFEGRSAAEIAAASGVPASTVRARLARGLELLRARLDRESGSRAAWMALVAPLVPREFALPGAFAASTTAVGALTVTLAKIALVASAAVVAGLAWWNFVPRGEPDDPFALAPTEVPPGTAALEPHLAATDGDPEQRSAVITSVVADIPESSGEESHPALAPELRGSFEARIVDAHDVPWVDADLRVSMPIAGSDQEVARGSSGPDGRVLVEVTLPKWAEKDRDAPGGAAASFDLVVRRAGTATRRLEVVVRAGQVTNLGDVVLVEAGGVRGRVVDEHGDAVADAIVGSVAEADFDALDASSRDRFVRCGAEMLEPLVARAVNPDGSFDLDDVAAGRVRLWAHAPGHRYALSEALDVPAGGASQGITLIAPALGDNERIAGRVVAPDGAGRPASISRDMRSSFDRRMDFIQTEPDGRFEFPVRHLDGVYELGAIDGYGEFPQARVTGVRPGDLEVVIAFRRGRSVQVRLNDEQGVAVEAAELWISSQFMMSQAVAEVVEAGVYELEWPGGSNELEVRAKGYRAGRTEWFDAASVPDVIELTLLRAPLVRGIVSADGSPVAGARVESFPHDPSGSGTVNGLRCTISAWENGSCTTDSAGRFELYVDAEGPIVVRASARDWVDVESVPFDAASRNAGELLELALGRGGSIEGRVLVPAGESPAGRIVGAHRGDGRPISVRTAEDGRFRFDQLMPGDWYVLPLAAEFPPHGGSYSSTSTTDPMPWSCRVEEGRATRFDLDLAGG